MTWFSRLFAGQSAPGVALTARQQQCIAAWQQLPAPDLRRSHYRCRYVVVDVETSGINVRTDRLYAIGAVALVDGQIDFRDALQLILASAAPTREAAAAVGDAVPVPVAGPQAVEALIAFLQFVGKAPLVAYNVPFVAAMVERVLAECLGIEFALPWIDLEWVMPDLFRDLDSTQGRLDAWLTHFEIDSIHRHNAVSDAYATAQLLQVTIARGARKGFETPASLLELEKARRHLHQSS